MSQHGPPGGPYFSQPSRASSDRPNEYTPPSDPWSAEDPWHNSASSAPASGAPQPGHHLPGQAYGSTPPPGSPAGIPPTVRDPWQSPHPWLPAGPALQEKRRSNILTAAVVVLAALLCGAGGTATYLFGESRGAKTNQAVETPTSMTERTTPVTSGSPEATTAATAGPSLVDVRFVKVGECVKSGDDNETLMFRITECGPDTYQVLQRFEGSVDDDRDAEAKCSGVPGYTNWYFYKSGFDALDFVLCLKLR